MRKNKELQVGMRGLVCFAVMMAFPMGAFAGDKLTADQIMEKAFSSRQLAGSEAVMTLSIYNEKGQARVRDIAMITKLFDKGKTEKKLYRFLSPADVKGTGVLTFDYETKDDDMWIFLPALRKTRKIVSSDKSKNFMGSEFTYADMNRPIIANYNLKIVKEEKAGGTDCWMIEALPKKKEIAEEDGYSKREFWIGKGDFMLRRSLFYDLDGKLLKEYTAKNMKLVDEKAKIYRAMYLEMVNKQNGRRSVFETKDVQSSPNADDSHFTQGYLER